MRNSMDYSEKKPMPEFKLRYHQQAVVDACRDILAGGEITEIVLSVTPGGGKSFVPVILAENLIPKIADRICWVVPRNALKYQGEGEFSDPRWNTDKRVRAADNGDDLSRGLQGYVTTYQAVGMNPDCHAAEFRKHRYILFLDECHHVADGSEWHKALEAMVKSAVLVVKASGTLSRGDGQKIAFMAYKDSKPDLSGTANRRVIIYGRNRAIADKAILPVDFRTMDGDAEWEEQDGSRGESRLSGEDSAKALFTALRTGFADNLLDAALDEFRLMRSDYPEAKMLVVAPNIEVAKAYHSHLADCGYETRIATSEDTPLARRNLDDFKWGVYRVLVTVAMAYEGLNVPEVACICCLSHIRSVPWLEQCFARANRLAPGKKRAVCFAPADWAFKKAVGMIKREELVPLSDGQQELFGGEENRGEGNGSGNARPWIIPLSSSAEGADDTMAEKKAELPPCPPSEMEKILRKNINGIISSYLATVNNGSKQAYSRMLYRRLRLVVPKPVSEMTGKELEKVWIWLRREYGGDKK